MATVKFHIGNGQFIEGEAEVVTSMLKALGIGAVAPTSIESGRGAKDEHTLTKEEQAIVDKWKPTHRKGTDEWSFTWCKKECAYEFTGGRDAKYNEAKYKKGKLAFLHQYGKDDTIPDTI